MILSLAGHWFINRSSDVVPPMKLIDGVQPFSSAFCGFSAGLDHIRIRQMMSSHGTEVAFEAVDSNGQ